MSKNNAIKLYFLTVEDGKIKKIGGYEFWGEDKFEIIGDPIREVDSELYVFTNITDYNDENLEKAIIHKSIKYIHSKSSDDKSIELRDDITISTGFCEYDSEKDNIVPKESYTLYGNGDIGYEKYGKSYIKVDGLKEDEELDLYVILYEYFDGPHTCTKAGSYIFTAQDNCFIGACTEDWARTPYYGGSATLYVFTDYDAYMECDLGAAVASGSITKIDGY